jgi:hypothetical protein
MPQEATNPALRIHLDREKCVRKRLVSKEFEEHVKEIHEMLDIKRHERILRVVKFACEPQAPSKVVLDKFANVEALWANTANPNVDTLLSYTNALIDAIDTGIREAQLIQSSYR